MREIIDLKVEANVFTRHESAKDWFFHSTEYVISKVVSESDNQILELDMIFDYLLNYTEYLLKRLVDYELFEEAVKVKEQTDLFVDEISNMMESQSIINKR